MKFLLVVGDGEKHVLEYESDNFSGSIRIQIDKREVKHSRRFLFKPLKEKHLLDIGRSERCEVTIETERNLFFGEKNRVYVNGRLAKCYESTDESNQ